MNSADTTLYRLKELNEIGIALSQRSDITTLLETILLAAKRITNADGGTLYLYDRQEQVLCFEILHNDSLQINLGGTSGVEVPLPPILLYDEAGRPNHNNVASHAALSGETVNIPDAYAARGYDFYGTKEFDQITGYRSQSFLTVPMRDHEEQVIGVLQLINVLEPGTREVVPFSHDSQRLVESLASQAAIALSCNRLIVQMEELFESFVRMINTAIDDKSPYTSGHCSRVPELTMMLAEAANGTAHGPWKEFALSENDRRELRLAGMLHDCGKITTPVHVVDKATKLETIFDRIHLVDTRFEVLKRDAEIAMLREIVEAKGEAGRIGAAREDFAGQMAQFDRDRDFLRHCNFGVELMSDADQERVRSIASYQWCDVDGRSGNFLSDNETENLTIRAGTLTAPERDVITHHIDITIKMLESLNWPLSLKNVTEYASGHHERMDGKGYPRGLTRLQMPVQARMIGIADIFEALTANDRPYKKGKTLSESLIILGNFKLSGHIDPDLFDLFMRERIYLDYARKFLAPWQLDEVDLRRIPGIDADLLEGE